MFKTNTRFSDGLTATKTNSVFDGQDGSTDIGIAKKHKATRNAQPLLDAFFTL